jgi:hypothetical protein
MVTRFIDSDRLTALASEEFRSQEPYPCLNERLLRPEAFPCAPGASRVGSHRGTRMQYVIER